MESKRTPVTAKVTPRSKTKEINDLGSKLPVLPPTSQGSLFHIEKQTEFDGIEMGVLESGLPYLSGRGLARMCGIDHKSLHELASNWPDEKFKPRGKVINQLLEQAGYAENTLYMRSEHGGTEVNAYPEPVCMALLEYYAFLADEKREKAVNAFRALARLQFRDFVYKAVGYSPEQRIIDSWKHFHDRLDLTKDSVPLGYFGVYGAIASMIIPMISAGVVINDSLIPDISVGRAWSAHWKSNNLAAKYGDRKNYEHNYPDYYPQAKSNPQEPYAYPDDALGEFKRWLRQTYIVTKLPAYLTSKVRDKAISFSAATNATLALTSNKVTGNRLAAPGA